MRKFSLRVLDKYCAKFDEAYAVDSFDSVDSKCENIRDEYLYFSKFWQHAFIKSDYIIDTGNFQTCNRALLYRIEEKINDHPILWKLFRRIFAV